MLQFQRPVMRQEQRQKMTMQMIQSINLLPLTITELRQKIEEELERNPALEVIEEKNPAAPGELEKFKSTEVEYFEESSDTGYRQRSYSDDEDPQRMFIEGVLSQNENLHEHLLWQLRLQKLSPAALQVGELLIQNLSEDGFHLELPETLVKDPELTHLVPRVAALIQGFDPIGCCTKDYKESLQVQMRLIESFPYQAQTIVNEHFDLLQKGKHAEIAHRMKISEAQVVDLLEDIRLLSPFPGRAYSQEASQYVTPDAIIRMKNGILVLVFNEEEIPILGVESFFKEQAEAGSENKAARQFVKQQVSDAERFIQNLRFRRNTLFQVCRAIMDFQLDFFRKGPKYLKPLTLKDVAQELEINESTVSRITTGKYVQTEWGIYELKYFFSNSITGSGSTGSLYSKEGVKQIIKEILKENAAGKKISDQKISDLLSQRGIEIARRTVTKYRKELSESLN